MASALVEIMLPGDCALASVDGDSQLMSLDSLCLSVKSISLTDSSAVENATQQIVNDDSRVVDSVDRDEDKLGLGIDKQLPKLDENLAVGQVTIIPVQHDTEEAIMTSLEKGERVELEDQKIGQDLRTGSENKAELLAERDRTESGNHREDGTRLQKLRPSIPQEHDENGEEDDEIVSGIVPRGPPGGIPMMSGYGGQDVFQMCPQYGGFGDCRESVAKYRKPPPEYVPPPMYANPPAIMLSPLMNGGNVFVHRPPFQFGEGASFIGGQEPPQLQEPVIRTPVINLVNNEVDNFIDEVLQNQRSISSAELEFLAENLPGATTDAPPDQITFTGTSTHTQNGSTGFSVSAFSTPRVDLLPTVDQYTAFPAVLSKPTVDVSSTVDEYSDVISPGSAWSSQQSPGGCVMSPVSNDSGLEDELSDLLDYINDDLKKNHQRQASGQEIHATGNPHIPEQATAGNPRCRNPSFEASHPGNSAPNANVATGHQNQAMQGLPTMFQLMQSCTVPSVITNTAGPVSQCPVTCIFVPSVATQPAKATPQPQFRSILPRPQHVPQDNRAMPSSPSAGLLLIFMKHNDMFDLLNLDLDQGEEKGDRRG